MEHALEPINHWLKIDEVIKLHEGATFIGEFPICEGAEQCGSVFYQPNPPHDYSNSFMIYYDYFKDAVMITSADRQAAKTYNGIITPCGDFIYSRHRHDCVIHDGCMIDGGDAYVRSNIHEGENIKFKIEGDKIVIVKKDFL